MRKREIILAVGAGALAAGAIAIALEDDDRDDFSIAVDIDNEDTVEMTYDLSGFDAVSVNGAQDVAITYGEEFVVRGEGPGSVMDQMEAVVEDGVLHIRHSDGEPSFSLDNVRGTTFSITMPTLSRLTTQGAGDVEVDRISSESFEAIIGGAGEVDIFGSATSSISQSGLGSVSCEGGPD